MGTDEMGTDFTAHLLSREIVIYKLFRFNFNGPDFFYQNLNGLNCVCMNR